MNIKFENVLNRTVENIKGNWLASIGYSLLITVLILAFSFVYGIIIGLALIIVLAFGSLASFIISLIFIIVISILLGMPVLLISKTAKYIVARKLTYDEGIFTSMKKVITLSNILEYFVRLILPIIGIIIGYTILVLISSIISEVFGLVVLILALLPAIAAMIYVASFFDMALYAGTEIKKNRIEMKSKYSNKQIFLANLVPFSIFVIINIVSTMFGLIPVIGFIISAIIGGVCGPAVAKAMILEVNQIGDKKSVVSPDNAIIKSDRLVVAIDSYGAQITSVKKGEKEIMWQADPEYWGKTAPVLFPFVGRLKDDQYLAGGNMLKMNQHGFLRERIFTIINQDVNSVTFEYTSTLADFNVYPVDFTVQITYRVLGSSVTTNYKVINNSNYPMPYQIGGHPGFNVDSVDDLVVEFEPQTVTKHYFRDALQSYTETTELNTLNLSYDLINQNIPCYSDFSSNKLTIKQNGVDFLKFEFDSMKYLAIWSPEYKNAKFVCIEPWNGICSREDQSDYLLENKDGMNVLAANSSEVCSYTFEVC